MGSRTVRSLRALWVAPAVGALIFMTGGSAWAASPSTTTVNCTSDPGALANALAGASDGDTLAIQGTCKGLFDLTHNLTLAGSSGATLDGQSAGTVLVVEPGKTALITGITVTGGSGPNGGTGGVLNWGALTLQNSAVSGNIAGVNGAGGGILNTFGANLTITGSTISGNSGGSSGGGIFNNGTLTVNTSTISGNSSGGPNVAGNGGGVYVNGTATITGSTITGNTANNGGGGITNAGSLVLSNSTVSGNTGTFGGGGGIDNAGMALTIESTTIAGNTAVSGGGIQDDRGLTVTNSTIANNTAAAGGGGIFDLFGAPETISFTTIVGNTTTTVGGGIFNFFNLSGATQVLQSSLLSANKGGNCSISNGPTSSIVDGGYNLEDGTSCGFVNTNHSMTSTNPLLDPAGLAKNGGPTQTIALQAGSPAIDAIPPTANGCGTSVTTDQRGVTRPQGSGCDIGAYEFIGSPCTFVEGTGLIKAANGDRAVFHVKFEKQSQPAEADDNAGNVQTYRDSGPASRFRFKSAQITSATCNGNKSGTITGIGKIDGGASISFIIDVFAGTNDAAEKGGQPATYRIRLSNGYDSGQQLVHEGEIHIGMEHEGGGD